MKGICLIIVTLLLLINAITAKWIKEPRVSGVTQQGRIPHDPYAGHYRSPGALPRLPLPSNVINVPLYLQETDFSCGPSSALSVLRYWLWDTYYNVTEKELYGPMNCTREEGTDPEPIARYFREYAHLEAMYMNSTAITLQDLFKAIDDRNPPIVDFQAWPTKHWTNENWTHDWVDGHYNVLIGYDETYLYLMDPSTQGHYAYIPQEEFVYRWHDIEGSVKPYTRVQRMVIFISGWNPTPNYDHPDFTTYEP